MHQSFQKRGGDCIARWEGSPYQIGSDTNYQYYAVEVRDYCNSVSVLTWYIYIFIYFSLLGAQFKICYRKFIFVISANFSCLYQDSINSSIGFKKFSYNYLQHKILDKNSLLHLALTHTVSKIRYILGVAATFVAIRSLLTWDTLFHLNI